MLLCYCLLYNVADKSDDNLVLVLLWRALILFSSLEAPRHFPLLYPLSLRIWYLSRFWLFSSLHFSWPSVDLSDLNTQVIAAQNSCWWFFKNAHISPSLLSNFVIGQMLGLLSMLSVSKKLLSRVQLFATPWTVAYQAPSSMGFSRQEYWSELPVPSPGDLSSPRIKPGSPTL